MTADAPTPGQIPAYAVAYLRNVDLNADIVEYIHRISATLAPYAGRFLVHGGRLTPLEGTWDGDVVIIAFPDHDAARAWYASPGYQAILALRVDNSESIATIVEGVPPGYEPTAELGRLVTPG